MTSPLLNPHGGSMMFNFDRADHLIFDAIRHERSNQPRLSRGAVSRQSRGNRDEGRSDVMSVELLQPGDPFTQCVDLLENPGAFRIGSCCKVERLRRLVEGEPRQGSSSLSLFHVCFFHFVTFSYSIRRHK